MLGSLGKRKLMNKFERGSENLDECQRSPLWLKLSSHRHRGQTLSRRRPPAVSQGLLQEVEAWICAKWLNFLNQLFHCEFLISFPCLFFFSFCHNAALSTVSNIWQFFSAGAGLFGAGEAVYLLLIGFGKAFLCEQKLRWDCGTCHHEAGWTKIFGTCFKITHCGAWSLAKVKSRNTL